MALAQLGLHPGRRLTGRCTDRLHTRIRGTVAAHKKLSAAVSVDAVMGTRNCAEQPGWTSDLAGEPGSLA